MAPEALTALLHRLAEEAAPHLDAYDRLDASAIRSWAAHQLSSEPVPAAIEASGDRLLVWLALARPRSRISKKRGGGWTAPLTVGGFSFCAPVVGELPGLVRVGHWFSYDTWVELATGVVHEMHIHGAFPEPSPCTSRELWALMPILAEYQARARLDLAPRATSQLRSEARARALTVAPGFERHLDHELRERGGSPRR